jgi:DNA-binding NtrC family response regulator
LSDDQYLARDSHRVLAVAQEPMQDMSRTAPAIIVDGAWRRPPGLDQALAFLGYVLVAVDELTRVPGLLQTGAASAVILGSRALGLKDLLAIRQSRSQSPAVPIVVITGTGVSQTDLKRALDDGATAFLSWPCPAETLRSVLDHEGDKTRR